MKLKRLKEMPSENASKGHIKIFNLIKELFSYGKIYQEYPYSKILNDYYKKFYASEPDNSLLKQSTRLHADIWLPSFQLIIEIQGEQHYNPIIWSSNLTEEDALFQYEHQLEIDKLKRRIAKEACVSLLEIKYDEIEIITSKELLDKIIKIKN